LSVFLATLVVSSLPCLLVGAQIDYYHEDFKWSYMGYEWTWSLDIPMSSYAAYKSVPVLTRTRNGLAGYGFLTTTNDPYLGMVAEKLQEAADAENYESYDKVSFVLAFVQSLPYTSDSVTSRYDEYPRFPLETLVDNGGDCEDTSILFATLTLIMGYGTVYLNPPDHYAVGILGDNLIGSYFTYNGKTYYYCETTGDGFGIGDIPVEYENDEAYIYPINSYEQYTPSSLPDSPDGVPDSNDGTSDTSDGGSGYSGLDIPIYIGIGIVAAVVLVISLLAIRIKKKDTDQPVATAGTIANFEGNNA